MGTNFYWHNPCNEYGQAGLEHLGKRSAAGKWCWDCNKTLYRGEKDEVHLSNAAHDWAKACTQCGVTPAAYGAEVQNCVKGCCSFSWAVNPIETMALWKGDERIEDEYGKAMTVKEFWDEALWCRIHFYDSIGRDFT